MPVRASSSIEAAKLAELWYGLYNPVGTNNTAELNALYHALRMAEEEIKNGKTVRSAATRRTPSTVFALGRRFWEKERVGKNRAARSKP
jgi:hypothetical protein